MSETQNSRIPVPSAEVFGVSRWDGFEERHHDNGSAYCGLSSNGGGSMNLIPSPPGLIGQSPFLLDFGGNSNSNSKHKNGGGGGGGGSFGGLGGLSLGGSSTGLFSGNNIFSNNSNSNDFLSNPFPQPKHSKPQKEWGLDFSSFRKTRRKSIVQPPRLLIEEQPKTFFDCFTQQQQQQHQRQAPLTPTPKALSGFTKISEIFAASNNNNNSKGTRNRSSSIGGYKYGYGYGYDYGYGYGYDYGYGYGYEWKKERVRSQSLVCKMKSGRRDEFYKLLESYTKRKYELLTAEKPWIAGDPDKLDAILPSLIAGRRVTLGHEIVSGIGVVTRNTLRQAQVEDVRRTFMDYEFDVKAELSAAPNSFFGGGGGKARILLVQSRHRGKQYVMKAVPTSDKAMLEARIATCVSNRNLAKTRCAWREGPWVYLLMNAYAGNLESYITTMPKGWVPPEPLLLSWLRDVTAGLENLHSVGVLHLDIKPANIYFKDPPSKDGAKGGCNGSSSNSNSSSSSSSSSSGGGSGSGGSGKSGNRKREELVLGDFGSARDLSMARCTAMPLDTVGDDRYMAPESTASPQADVYSLGTTFFDILMDIQMPRKPLEKWFEIRSGSARDIITRSRPQLAASHKHAIELIDRMMAPAPDLRPTAAALLKDIDALLIAAATNTGVTTTTTAAAEVTQPLMPTTSGGSGSGNSNASLSRQDQQCHHQHKLKHHKQPHSAQFMSFSTTSSSSPPPQPASASTYSSPSPPSTSSPSSSSSSSSSSSPTLPSPVSLSQTTTTTTSSSSTVAAVQTLPLPPPPPTIAIATIAGIATTTTTTSSLSASPSVSGSSLLNDMIVSPDRPAKSSSNRRRGGAMTTIAGETQSTTKGQSQRKRMPTFKRREYPLRSKSSSVPSSVPQLMYPPSRGKLSDLKEKQDMEVEDEDNTGNSNRSNSTTMSSGSSSFHEEDEEEEVECDDGRLFRNISDMLIRGCYRQCGSISSSSSSSDTNNNSNSSSSSSSNSSGSNVGGGVEEDDDVKFQNCDGLGGGPSCKYHRGNSYTEDDDGDGDEMEHISGKSDSEGNGSIRLPT